VILCYLEQIKDGRRFARAVRALHPSKRLVVVKSGRSTAGAAAVGSHTGAIAGDDAVVDGVFEQLGIIRARDSATAVDAATALAAGKVLQGQRIGVLSVAGGLAVELTDLLELRGFSVPEFDPVTRERLNAIVPAFGATRNPVDLTGAVLTQEDLFENALQAMSQAEGIDGFAVISTFLRNPRYAHAIVRLFRSTDKPVIVCWTGSVQQTPESLAILAEAGVPVYDNTARAAHAFCALRRDPSIG
jgi:acyl-CoA synthetase (NDP forming)